MTTDTTNEEAQIIDSSLEEVSAWLDSDDEADEFIDTKLVDVRKARSLLQFWQEITASVDQLKEGYRLAKLWKDDELKNQYLEQGNPLVKKLTVLKTELEEFLPRVEGINFISDAELSILPKWIHKSLGVDSNALESRMKDLGV